MSLSVASPTVCVWAPGKVNVLLRVGPVESSGYHEIATIFQAVSLYEEVRASRADTVTVTFEGDDIDTSGLVVDDTNLAIRAARAVAAHTGVTEGVRLEIHKRVPIAGGMGGGSADAAATLVACDELWGTHIPKDDLYDIAATLGADVPFALSGGTAMGTGRGDLLSPVLSSGEFHWVLAVAEFGLSTSDIYRECDALRAQSGAEIPENLDIDKRVLQALRSGDPVQLAEVLHNDLQEAALHKAPGLRGILDLGQKHGALAGLVSGSGPTIAFLAEDKHAAIGVQVALSAARLNVIRVKAPAPGARVLS